jgi:hypothetical protein
MPNKKAGEPRVRSPQSKQNTRRVRFGLKTFTQYGINFGDTAIVAMNTDEVRMGELGYFSIKAPYGQGNFNQFAFLCESDEACNAWTPKTGICLRAVKHSCLGRHEGEPYGRVCAVERDRKPVETTLELRPYDERMDAFNPASFKPLNPKTAGPKTAKEKERAARWRVKLTSDCDANLGLYCGDVLIVNPNGEAPLGKIIGLKAPDDGLVWFARVCINNERGVYLFAPSDGRDEWGWLVEYDYSAFGPVIEIKRASEVNAEKIAELKKRIEKIRRNDWDSICDTTRQYELERELYALENPIGDEEEDDWPELIGAKP